MSPVRISTAPRKPPPTLASHPNHTNQHTSKNSIKGPSQTTLWDFIPRTIANDMTENEPKMTVQNNKSALTKRFKGGESVGLHKHNNDERKINNEKGMPVSLQKGAGRLKFH